jgi:hypothetical protein
MGVHPICALIRADGAICAMIRADGAICAMMRADGAICANAMVGVAAMVGADPMVSPEKRS